MVLLNSPYIYISFIENCALLASKGKTAVNDKMERIWAEAAIVVYFKVPSTFLE
jgi:hypothetical protein